MIPKIIHYCWFGPKPFPKTVQRCIATWHKHLPDYEFRLWNEENSPMDHPFVRSAYATKKYAFVADYVRFWALYNYGGIYLDTDMYVIRSFDDLLDCEFFCGWETSEDNHFGACALGACALGACARDVLAKYDTLIFDSQHLDQFIIPHVITPIILKYREDVVIYPYDYFYPLPYNERFVWNKLKFNTPNTYAVHLWDISWGKWRAKQKDKLMWIYKKLRKFIKHA